MSKENIPTLEEVRAYCKEINSPINPQEFHDYYRKKKWQTIKDWRKAVKIWGKIYSS